VFLGISLENLESWRAGDKNYIFFLVLRTWGVTNAATWRRVISFWFCIKYCQQFVFASKKFDQ